MASIVATKSFTFFHHHERFWDTVSPMKLRGSWRKIRSKIGIRSQRVAIRTHTPWYIKFGGYGIAMGVAAAIAWVIVDNSYRITGFSREEAKQQIATLQADNAKLKQSYDSAKSQLNEKESRLKVEQSSQAELARNVVQLQDENASLKEDIGFLRNVMSSGTVPEGLQVQNFKVEADALPNEFRYRLLLTQGGQRKQDFKGKVQIIARVQSPGQAQQTVLSFPTDDALKQSAGTIEFRFYQKIDGRFTIPEGAQLKNVQVRVLGLPALDVRAQRNINL
jgi:DNA-binding transcriptional MerR regulator